MKGINLQFDNLLTLIDKNAVSKGLFKSRDSFELVYQKITHEALKIVALVFDYFVDDLALKTSFKKLTKELKLFLAQKPLAQQQEDDYFNRQLDQVQQFMNNRKPVMTEVDNLQRGDIVRYLVQAENKEKDIQEFIGNMSKFGSLSNGAKKLKTVKHIAVATRDEQTQTGLNMTYFEKLQKKMPSLFRIEELTAKCNGQSPQGSEGNTNTSELPDFDIDAHIDLMIKQKVEEAQKIVQAQQIEKYKEKQKEQMARKQKNLQIQQAKKKKPQLAQKRNSDSNSTKPASQMVTNTTKAKSAFSKEISKKGATTIDEEKKQNMTAANSAERLLRNNYRKNTLSIGNYKEAESEESKINSAMPSFDQIFSTLSGVKGIENISQEQMKIIYESIKLSTAESIMKSQLFSKPQTLEQECNTSVTYASDAVTDEMGNFMEDQDGQDGGKDQKDKFSKKNSPNARNKGENGHMSIDEEDEDSEAMEARDRTNSNRAKHQTELNRGRPNNLSNLYDGMRISPFDPENPNSVTRGGLPNISRYVDGDIINKLEKSDSTSMLVKEGKSAEQFLKNLKDTKYLKPVSLSKSLNKQNYTLDMYKSKLDNKNRASEHINLPSLGQNGLNNKAGMSLHQNMLDNLKSPYMKRTSKKNINLPSSEPLFPSTNNNTQEGFFKKGQKGSKEKESFREQERIMKELQRIAKDGAVMSNMKHIAMYIQFVESVHARKCGEKCVHLERFYEFLRKNNLPNRRELVLHRADMNASAQI